MQTRREAGELLFEKYLAEQGYGLPQHEPDLGVGKRPDYIIKRDDYRCVCEVKEFAPDASSLPRTPGYSSTGMDFVLKPIRSQIRQAAPQLKPLAASGMALVVVIANPHHATVFTGDREAACAMYGDLAVTFTINPEIGAAEGDPVWIADRNGKLTNDHPYISAVVFLREPGYGATAFAASKAFARRTPGVIVRNVAPGDSATIELAEVPSVDTSGSMKSHLALRVRRDLRLEISGPEPFAAEAAR